MLRAVLSIAAMAAVWYVPADQAQARGDAPWCAVTNDGTGDISWHCVYPSFDECLPEVLTGNRGFCNVNPYWQAAHPGEEPPKSTHPARPAPRHPAAKRTPR